MKMAIGLPVSILAAARTNGVRELFPEDLNHGQDHDGIRVINQFVK